MKHSPILAVVLGALLTLPFCGCQESSAHDQEEHHEAAHRIVVTSPAARDVTTSEQYVCQIHSCRHIEVCAMDSGFLQEIPVKEGQSVEQDELMFKLLPTIYQAKFETESAEAQTAQLEYNNTKQLFDDGVVSQNELALAQAKLAKARAQADLARAELNFTEIRAPFAGIIDRLHNQQGSLIEEGEVLTTLSDNSVMWVYFNVPEARYLEYKEEMAQGEDDLQIELMLANGKKFDQPGAIGAIEADFNNETGNIAFRADFPNPNGLLRHGQTGTLLINRLQKDAIVVPQRATFEILDRRFVFVVDGEGVAHQREIVVQQEMDDIFLIESGVDVNDKIVFEGVRQVRDGEEVEYEYVEPKEVLANLKFKAE